LTLWYVALLGVVLLTFSIAFYSVLKFSLTSEVDRVLQDRARQVVAGIQTQNNLFDILRTGIINVPELDVFSSRSIFIQVLNAQGEVIRASPNLMGNHLPLDDEILADIRQGKPNFKTLQLGLLQMRLYSAPLTFGNRIIGVVQVGNPLNEIQTTLRRVSLFLIGGTIVALVLATLFGAILAHVSLRPIDHITLTANQIVSAQDLGQRLPTSGNNDEIDRLSQTINNMLARLDDFFQAQIRLTADISHELRTPLTIIHGNVDVLRRDSLSPAERAEAIAAINSALNRMSRLVSDLLLLSQADAGMTLAMRPLELDEVILDVFQQAHALTKEVSLKLGHADQARVRGDADRLKQLLINLLDNAIKHTPPGGCVTLSVYRQPPWVRVSVADTGEGIPLEHLPHIFDRFYRVKGQKRKGYGLGLPIAKWIAEAHGGTLTAESQPGAGSTFTLKLPLANDD